MKITNKLGLPQPFVSAVEREYQYADKRYSATSLLKGVREAILQRRHDDEIESDVADMAWAIFGTAVHGILENAEETATQIKENKLEVEMPNGYTLSGIFDLYDDETGTVTDYKTASVWKLKFGCWDNWEPKPGEFEDWRKQTLIYCWMLRQIGFDAKRGQIVALLKDHSKTKAAIGEHPPLPIYQIAWDFAEKDFAEIEDYLTGKFAQIEVAEKLPDDELPICTEEERWTRGEAYAVMKKGTKRAKKLFKAEEYKDAAMAAQTFAEGMGSGFYVEHRPGRDGKCLDYCSAAPFCSHYKRITEEA